MPGSTFQYANKRRMFFLQKSIRIREQNNWLPGFFMYLFRSCMNCFYHFFTLLWGTGNFAENFNLLEEIQETAMQRYILSVFTTDFCQFCVSFLNHIRMKIKQFTKNGMIRILSFERFREHIIHKYLTLINVVVFALLI